MPLAGSSEPACWVRDGEWQKATGVCVSYFTVAFVAGIIVIVIMDVTLLFLRMEKRIRTIGGMK